MNNLIQTLTTQSSAETSSSSIKNKAPTPDEYIVLHSGYCIPKDLCDSVKYQVESILPALLPDVDYTLKELCGEEYWNKLEAGHRKLAGRFIAYLVSRNLLPLSFGPKTDANAKTYRLK